MPVQRDKAVRAVGGGGAGSGVYARLVQHQHLRMQQAGKVALRNRPHARAARARDDDHAVTQRRSALRALQGLEHSAARTRHGPLEEPSAWRGALFYGGHRSVRLCRTRAPMCVGGHATRQRQGQDGRCKKGQRWAGLGQDRHRTGRGPRGLRVHGAHGGLLEDQHLLRLLRLRHRHGLAALLVHHRWAHAARQIRVGVAQLHRELLVHVLRQ